MSVKGNFIPRRWSRLALCAGWVLLGWTLAGFMRRGQSPKGTRMAAVTAPKPWGWGGAGPMGPRAQAERAKRQRRQCGVVCQTWDGRSNASAGVEPLVKEYECARFFRHGSSFDGVSSKVLPDFLLRVEVGSCIKASLAVGGDPHSTDALLYVRRQGAHRQRLSQKGARSRSRSWWTSARLGEVQVCLAKIILLYPYELCMVGGGRALFSPGCPRCTSPAACTWTAA